VTAPPEGFGHDLPPLDWLRAFEAAARLGSFTAAARELTLTQAAVSHHVRSLERRLGVALFVRLPRSLRLTEIGAAYLPPVRQCFEELGAATAGLFGPKGRRSLAVRAPVSFAALWLAPRLAGFAAAHPGVALRVTSAVWTHPEPDDPSDIEIRFGAGPWPGRRAELLAHWGAVAVCRPDLAPRGEGAARMAALGGSALIHVAGYEDLWRRLLQPHGVSLPPFSGVNVDTSLAALELAASGHGPAIVLEGFARPYIAAGRLTLATDERLAVEQAHYLLGAPDGRRPPPEAAFFRDWLKREAARG
jgi:LysR family glycine cleavage system transcriptional activator